MTKHIRITPCFDYLRFLARHGFCGGFPLRPFLLFPASGCAYDKQQQKQTTDGGEDVIDDRHVTHLAKLAQRGGLIDIGKYIKVADVLGARFAFVQAWPRLVAAIYHITPVFLAVCHKTIAF